jgi:hypothetical protein
MLLFYEAGQLSAVEEERIKLAYTERNSGIRIVCLRRCGSRCAAFGLAPELD